MGFFFSVIRHFSTFLHLGEVGAAASEVGPQGHFIIWFHSKKRWNELKKRTLLLCGGQWITTKK